jgi:hypothetical protein
MGKAQKDSCVFLSASAAGCSSVGLMCLRTNLATAFETYYVQSTSLCTYSLECTSRFRPRPHACQCMAAYLKFNQRYDALPPPLHGMKHVSPIMLYRFLNYLPSISMATASASRSISIALVPACSSPSGASLADQLLPRGRAGRQAGCLSRYEMRLHLCNLLSDATCVCWLLVASKFADALVVRLVRPVRSVRLREVAESAKLFRYVEVSERGRRARAERRHHSLL